MALKVNLNDVRGIEQVIQPANILSTENRIHRAPPAVPSVVDDLRSNIEGDASSSDWKFGAHAIPTRPIYRGRFNEMPSYKPNKT